MRILEGGQGFRKAGSTGAEQTSYRAVETARLRRRPPLQFIAYIFSGEKEQDSFPCLLSSDSPALEILSGGVPAWTGRFGPGRFGPGSGPEAGMTAEVLLCDEQALPIL